MNYSWDWSWILWFMAHHIHRCWSVDSMFHGTWHPSMLIRFSLKRKHNCYPSRFLFSFLSLTSYDAYWKPPLPIIHAIPVILLWVFGLNTEALISIILESKVQVMPGTHSGFHQPRHVEYVIRFSHSEHSGTAYSTLYESFVTLCCSFRLFPLLIMTCEDPSSKG